MCGDTHCCGLVFAVWWLLRVGVCSLLIASEKMLATQLFGSCINVGAVRTMGWWLHFWTNWSVNNGLVIQWSRILCTVKSHMMGYFWMNRYVNNGLVIQWPGILWTIKSHIMGWCLQCEFCPRTGLVAASVGAVRIINWCLKMWMLSIQSQWINNCMCRGCLNNGLVNVSAGNIHSMDDW